MSLFSELKRRNVFKIGVAYLIVAWLLMQVTDLAAPRLFLPEWVPTFVVFILALGFPVALLLAWAYEVTPEGIKKTKNVPLEKSVRAVKGQRIYYVVIVLLTVAVLFLLVDRTRPPEVESEQLARSTTSSLAVLPFQNMTGNAEQEHFTDGLTEEILNVLASIEDLRLVSRTSSFTFKDRSISIPEVAEQLGVQHILEGSVRRSGDRIRITAQLISADSDSHIWSQTYERTLSVENLFEIQEEVAEAVAQVLHASLRTTDQQTLRVTPPQSIDAFDHYLEGMEHVRMLELGQINLADVSAFENAVASFEASIELDSNWAPSHAGLGRVHHFWLHLDRDRQLRLSREHVLEALRIDDHYGPAWASFGYIEMLSGNYEESLRAYNRARDLGAGNNWGRALLFMELAQYDRAVSEYRLALQWDPLSASVRGQLGAALYCAGRDDELLIAASELVDDHPDEIYFKVLLAYSQVKIGLVERGLTLANELADVEGSDLPVLDVLALAGERERVLRMLNAERNPDDWNELASAAAALGETTMALDILESVEGRLDAPGSGLRCSPEIRRLAGNPRYDALLQRLNLPE